MSDLESLEGRTVIVAGSAGGVGSAVVAHLLHAGSFVIGLDRRLPTLSIDPGARHQDFQVDLTDPLAVQEVVDRVARGGAAINGVVFCAGINVPERSAVQLSVADWQRLVDANLSAGFFLTRAVLSYLPADGGDVIFITSVSARWPDQSGPGYQAAKAGLHALSQALALELSDRGHRFTSVLPGLINTPLLDQRAVPPSEEIRHQALLPQDIAVLCGLILSFPRRVSIPEVVILPRALQAPGRT